MKFTYLTGWVAGGLLLAGCSGTTTPAPISAPAISESRPAAQSPAQSAPAGPADSGAAAPQSGDSAAATEFVAAAIENGSVTVTEANATIQFVGTKPDGKHDGGFGQFSGNIEIASDDFTTARIAVDIDVTSMWTDNPKLTQHLLSPDFFEARTNPKATFTSTAIQAADEPGKFQITGDLMLHGVTKSITFPATARLGDGTLKLRSEFQINRNDFGISFGPGRVNDEVTIRIAVGELSRDELKIPPAGAPASSSGGRPRTPAGSAGEAATP